MKKLFLSVAAAILAFPVLADEGMWLLPLLKQQKFAEMQALGLRLSDQEVYSAEAPSLKDAVVRFGGGCTGEMISPDGLVLTNHHCGYSSIQRHSTRQIVKKKPTNSAILEIDLHITELLDNTNGLSNADMLTYQLGKFREVMDQYALNNGQKIVFIHGKGDGVLRKAIEKDLKTRYKQHYFQDASFREYGFGATMVTIKADTSQHGH